MVTLYSTGCPKCNVLKKKLDLKGIKYEEIDSIEQMIEIGITKVPMLNTGTNLLEFKEANDWINNQ